MRWRKRARDQGEVKDAPRMGRPRVTSELLDAQIVHRAELEPFLPIKAIRKQLSVPISASTIVRRLLAAGLPSRIAAQKRHYTAEQKRARLSFAHGYKHWGVEEWERVIFSDEKTFEGTGRKRQQHVRRPDGTRFVAKYTKHSHIFAPSAHIFACFCARGPGYCKSYLGKLDGKALRRLMQDTVLPTRHLFLPRAVVVPEVAA